MDELSFGKKPFIFKLKWPIKIINDLRKEGPQSRLCRYNISTFMTLVRILPAKTQQITNDCSADAAYGGSLDWQRWQNVRIIVIHRKTKSCWLMLIYGDVSSIYETYHSFPFDSASLSCVVANFLQISLMKSRLWPPLTLHSVSFYPECVSIKLRWGGITPLKVTRRDRGGRGLDKNDKAWNNRSLSKAGVVLTLEAWGAVRFKDYRPWVICLGLSCAEMDLPSYRSHSSTVPLFLQGSKVAAAVEAEHQSWLGGCERRREKVWKSVVETPQI